MSSSQTHDLSYFDSLQQSDNESKDTEDAKNKYAYSLVEFKQHKEEFDKTLELLNSAASKDILDPNRDYKVLSHIDAEALLEVLGREPRDDRLTSYTTWDPEKVSNWAKNLHQQAHVHQSSFDNGKRSISELRKDASDALAGCVKHAVSINSKVNLIPSSLTTTKAYHLGKVLDDNRSLRSLLIAGEAFPEIASKIYSGLCSLHSRHVNPATIPPSARAAKSKKQQKAWENALSEAEIAVNEMRALEVSFVDPTLIQSIEKLTEAFETAITADQHKAVSQVKSLMFFDDSGTSNRRFYLDETLGWGAMVEELKQLSILEDEHGEEGGGEPGQEEIVTETATSKPWKSSYNWADDDQDDDDEDWTKKALEELRLSVSSPQVPTKPWSRKDGMSSAKFLFG